jgi:ribosomal protein S18 acetylase RimI-like enzyme
MKVTPLAIEHATLDTWPPREMAQHQGWRLCAASGVTGRVNACWPIEWRGESIDAAIDTVEAWYRARAMAPRFKLTDGAFAPADLTTHLARRRYASTMHTLIMTRPLAPSADTKYGVSLSPEMPPLFDQALRESTSAADELEERRAIAGRAPQPRAFAVRADGPRPLAVGMSACAGPLAGLFLMRTVPDARRQGHALHVARALLAWAARNGASTMFLQVDADNAPAIALYEREGFTALTRYCFWRPA